MSKQGHEEPFDHESLSDLLGNLSGLVADIEKVAGELTRLRTPQVPATSARFSPKELGVLKCLSDGTL